MGIIWAQGAEHTNPDRLHKIVTTINLQLSTMGKNHHSREVNKIISLYEPDFDPTWNVYDNVHYVCEIKYDGFSYINDMGRFFSKRPSTAKGSEGQPVEKTGHVPHLSNFLKQLYDYLGVDLHGELYKPGGISDDVSTIMGCGEDEAVRRQIDDDNKLHYMLIDIRKYRGKSVVDEPYYIRRALLEYVYYTFIVGGGAERFIEIAPVLIEDPCVAFRHIVLSGGEGVIFKRTAAHYIPGKKPADNWVKGKKKITLDVVIMGYNDGTGKNKSLFGSIEFGLYVDGVLKKMGSTSSGLDDDTRRRIAADPDSYIGWVIEIEAIQESKNSFRNAVFLRLREDKDKSECTPLNIRVKENLLDLKW